MLFLGPFKAKSSFTFKVSDTTSLVCPHLIHSFSMIMFLSWGMGGKLSTGYCGLGHWFFSMQKEISGSEKEEGGRDFYSDRIPAPVFSLDANAFGSFEDDIT